MNLSKWTSTKSLKCGSYRLVQFFGGMGRKRLAAKKRNQKTIKVLK
jgi:hypothetical protein